MPWVPWVLSGIGVLIALISLIRTFLVSGQDQSKKLDEEIGHVRERLGLIEMKLGIFWKLVEEHLGTLLKRPTHLEMDALLDRLKAHTLTLDEAHRLRAWLREVYLDSEAAHAQERIIAILVMAAVESLIHEKEHARC